jgi:hypothetical protein
MDLAALRVLLVALCLFSGHAVALYRVTGPAQWPAWPSGFVGTPGESCNSRAAAFGRASGVAHIVEVGGAYAANCEVDDAAGLWYALYTSCADASSVVRWGVQDPTICTLPVESCPSGTAPDAKGVCWPTCGAVGSAYVPSACPSDPCVVAAGTGLSMEVCDGQCVVRGQAAGVSGGVGYVWGPFSVTGAHCVAGVAGSPPVVGVPPLVCGVGQCPGSVNGNTACYPCSATQSPGASTSTSSSETPASGASSSSTGSTSSSTTCTGGNCSTTTTTTVTRSDGTTSQQQTTTTQPVAAYCHANPADPQCGPSKDEPSTWGGSCAGFSCGGDAIQCAIAREQHVRNCALFDQETDLSRLGKAAATGGNPSDHPRDQVQVASFALSSMLDSSPLFGSSGGCPADYAFSYAGQSLVIPFSQSCDVLHILGAMWMGICYLVAATIVFYRR